MIPVRFHTLGCRLNQLETEGIASGFREVDGTRPVPSGAVAASRSAGGFPAIHVVNTCTVTTMAEQKARRLVRSLLAREPDCAVLVTGCYAEVARGELERLGERVVVVEGSRKDSLLALPGVLDAMLASGDGLAPSGDGLAPSGDGLAPSGDGLAPSGDEAGRRGASFRGADLARLLRAAVGETARRGEGIARDPFAFAPTAFETRTRASLKVQDGCDNECAYCLVRVARGRSVSLDPALATARARAIEAAGAAEIVLTGVNLSQYRWGALDFAGLLRVLLDATSSARFRISSWEPDRVDDSFLDVFSDPRVCPFVHLAAQSLSDATLERMGRRYDGRMVAEAARRIAGVRDRPWIGFDVIAGFPGETDDEFAETEEALRAIGPAWIHAFPFSPRPGTRAARMPDPVPERVARERTVVLRAIAEDGLRRYARSCDGMETVAIVEDGGRATTANYLSVEVEGGPPLARGDVVRCRIEASREPASACFLEILR